ncbi:mannitol dehydrogenase family protein [Yoonia sp. BS5-3]|uniref:Mannitol dehydrogenase family protein n=1 Tax=Yoonia phaeophyticola TaxID=3137369 RepID=A0ABZ2VA19_9RHOB
MPDTPRLRRSPAPRPKTGIVHLGPGAFFRAFCGTYTADAMQAGGGDWGVCAVSLRSPSVRDQLGPQDCAYTSVMLGPEGPKDTVVEVINSVLVAPENPNAVLVAMADPAVKIVSMTITEKGYCHNPATGDLRADHPDIIHDLANPDAPRSALGFLVLALARRRIAGHPPFTVLPCDNLPDNGALTRKVVLAFARQVSPDLADWIAQYGAFPSTMVDRITPATTDADIDALAARQGYLDRACVMHEPFRQWVIEDTFVGSLRPGWDTAGAQFVTDVAAFESMKLRCLNGAHSALAYLGYLAGFETISQSVADEGFARFIRALWTQEVLPTIPPPEGTDLASYCDDLNLRFANPAIQHRTWQIAMDGSQKVPQRLLGTIADCLEAGRAFPCLALAVAGWMRYVQGVDEKGAVIDVRDPLAQQLKAAADTEDQVTGLLAVRDVFDPALAQNPEFSRAVKDAYAMLMSEGAMAAVRKAVL